MLAPPVITLVDGWRRGSRRLRIATGAGAALLVLVAAGATTTGLLTDPAAAAPNTAAQQAAPATPAGPQDRYSPAIFSTHQTYSPLGEDCRAIDTRKNASLRLTPGHPMTFDLSHACGMNLASLGSVAFEATVISVNASGPGTISVYPPFGNHADGPAYTPKGVLLSVVKGTNLSTAAALPLSYPQPGLSDPGYEVTFQSVTASTDLIVDIRGFFIGPQYARIFASGGAAPGMDVASGLTGSTRSSTGVYQVSFARTLAFCAPSVTLTSDSSSDQTAAVGFATAGHSATSGQSVEVHTFDVTGKPADRGFYLTMTC